MKNEETGKLETFAIVEVMGHGKFAGFVQQVPMGGAAMIRVDVPEIPESEEEYNSWDPVTGKMGTAKRKIPAMPAFTKFLGISSIFAITPCSEEVAMAAVKGFRSAPVSILSMPPLRPMLECDD